MSAAMRYRILAVAAAGMVFFTNLGGPRLWDEDEPKNASCTREMLARGDWVVPMFNDKLRTDKPVLLYWLMMASYSLLGATEFAARLPSAVLGVGTVWLVYEMGRRLYSPRAGLCAAVALASCAMFDVAARAATPDSTLIFFATLALAIFVLSGGIEQPRLPWPAMAAVYGAMGLAVLAKGPVGVALPTLVLVLFVLCRDRVGTAGATNTKLPAPPASRFARAGHGLMAGGRWTLATFTPSRVWHAGWQLRPITALVVVLLIALPWYLWVGLRTDGQWVAGFLGRHNVDRFLTPMENHRGPIFYYVIAILAGFFPWSIFLPGALVQAVLRARRDDAWQQPDLFALCWAGMYVGFFSLASTKLPSYVLPAYPALALLTGALIDRWLAQPSLLPRRMLQLAWSIPAVVSLAVAIALPLAVHILLPGETGAGLLVIGMVGGVAAVGYAVSGWWLWRGWNGRALVSFGATAVLFSATMCGVAAARVGQHHNSPVLLAALGAGSAADGPVHTFRHLDPSLVFYARAPVTEMYGVEQLADYWRRQPQARIISRAEFLPDIEQALGGAVTVVERRQRFLRRGEVVVVEPAAQTAEKTAGPLR